MQQAKTPATGHRVGLYIRVSTEEQASNPEGSIKSQEQRLRQYLQFRNTDGIFGDDTAVFVDRARSGKDTNRPELQRLLKAIRDKHVTMVMVTELSRLSRSLKDFCEIWQLMQAHGCQFQSLREQFDTTTAAGEMVLYSIANIAQFERKQVSERVTANFAARAARGLWNGGSIPFGYAKDPDRRGHLAINEDEAAIVREAFATFLLEGSLAPAGKSLNMRGYRLTRLRSGSGGNRVRLGHFTVDNLYNILTNPAYAGRRTFKVAGEEKTAKAAWEPIINEETFEHAGKILRKNYRRLKTHTNQRYPFMLSGLIYCAQCGDRLPGKSAHGRTRKYPYYEHGWAVKRQGYLNKRVFACEPHRIQAEKLEPRVWEEVERILTEPELAKALVDEAHRLHLERGGASELERLKGKVKGVEDQIEALAEHLAKIPKGISPAPIFRQMERLEALKQDAQAELMALEASTFTVDAPASLRDYNAFRAALRGLALGSANPNLKSKIVAKLIQKVEVKSNGFRLHCFTGARQVGDAEARNAKTPEASLLPGSSFFSNRGSNTLDFGRASRNLDEPAHYIDVIEHSVNPFKSKSSKIAEMCLKDGLSASQVAGKLGISKTAVLEKLHDLGIRNEASKGERMTNPNNYRAAVVPYGYRNADGQLVANKKEVRICRLVVQLINEQQLSLNGAARELMQKNIKNRNGNVWWDHSMVRGIYRRWNGKI